MADTKKYYWLKLDVNFFDKEEIRLIEGMPNGKDYIIFYMKLLLKGANTDGKLMFRNVIPYTVEMLSNVTNTNPDTVRTATDLFVQLNMMERLDDGALFMLETSNMVGSETIFAKKKREYRLKKDIEKKALTLKDNSKTKKDIVRQEKELDLDKEIEKDKNNNSSKKISKLDDVKLKINKLEVSDRLKQSLIEFAEYRKEIKKEVTFRSIKMTVKNLLDNKKYTSEEHLINSIENSISQGYTGIFPIEEKNNKFNNKSTDINLTDVV